MHDCTILLQNVRVLERKFGENGVPAWLRITPDNRILSRARMGAAYKMATNNSGLLGVTVSIPGLDLAKEDPSRAGCDSVKSSSTDTDASTKVNLPGGSTKVSCFHTWNIILLKSFHH